jgi:hypothetical protein
MSRFICPELFLSGQTFGPDDLYKKDPLAIDYFEEIVNAVKIRLPKQHQIITDVKENNFTLYGSDTVKLYSETFSQSGTLMTISEFLAAHSALSSANFKNLTNITTHKFTWLINSYNEIRSSFFYTVFTDSGICLVKPKRLSTSKRIPMPVIKGNHLNFNTNFKFEGESGGDFHRCCENDPVKPAVIDAVLKTQAINKVNSLADVVICQSGTDAELLDFFIDANTSKNYVILSKKELTNNNKESTRQFYYIAVLESDASYTFNGSNIYPLISSVNSNGIFVARDEKASGNDGGTAVRGAWTDHTLLQIHNTINGASIAANIITIPPGFYMIWASGRACAGNAATTFNIKIFNKTLTSDIIIANGDNGVGYYEELKGIISGHLFIINEFTNISMQYFYSGSFNTSTRALGTKLSIASTNEVYAELMLWKIG